MIIEQSHALVDLNRALSLFRNALAVKNSLILTYPLTADLDQIHNLETAVKNFGAEMRREAKYMIYSVENFKSDEWTMGILYTLLYKKNMARKKLAEIFQQLEQLSQLTPAEYYKLHPHPVTILPIP